MEYLLLKKMGLRKYLSSLKASPIQTPHSLLFLNVHLIVGDYKRLCNNPIKCCYRKNSKEIFW